MHDILLYEPNHERAIRLIFLLSLKDIHCTHVRSVEETLNCLSAQRLNIINFDLLLLGSSKDLLQAPELYAEVASMSAFPVVCIPCDNDNCACKLMPPSVVVCNPEGMLECVKEQLNLKESLLQTGSVQ